MKKLIVSLSVIILFVFYSWQQRQEVVSLPVVTQKSSTGDSDPQSMMSMTPMPMGKMMSTYRDGTYMGSVADAFYGNVQVQARIQSGKIIDVTFLQYPNDRDTSIEISRQAIPLLRQEAIRAQDSHVDVVSGATQTSEAFVQSLGDALRQAS